MAVLPRFYCTSQYKWIFQTRFLFEIPKVKMFTFSAGTDVDDAPAIDRNHDDDDTDDFVCLI